MRHRLNLKNMHYLAFLLGLFMTLLAPFSGNAAECPHGSLDARYCDQDNDMVADLPTGAVKAQNPPQLIFAYTPLEDPSVYKEVWQGFLDHMEKVTGKKVTFFSVQSNAAQIEAMRAGRLHVTSFSTGSTPIAVNCAGYVPVAMMGAADNSYGFEMEIVVGKNSPIQTPADLKGKNIAFTSPTSHSGFKAPSAILKSQFKLVADRDFKSSFSGKHDNSILGVVHGDYDAAAVANDVLHQMVARGALQPDALRSVYKSASFPTASFGYAYNLEPALAAKIRESFFTFDWKGSKLATEFKDQAKFIPITYKQHWSDVRAIDTENGVDYACK